MNPFHSRMPSLVEIGQMVLEKKIFKFCYFIIIYYWKRSGPFIWRNLHTLHLKMICTKFGWNWSWRRFLKVPIYFCNFVINTSWKRAWPFISTNLNARHPRMHCSKFGWNWTVVMEKKIFNFVIVFSLFRNYLPL